MNIGNNIGVEHETQLKVKATLLVATDKLFGNVAVLFVCVCMRICVRTSPIFHLNSYKIEVFEQMTDMSMSSEIPENCIS